MSDGIAKMDFKRLRNEVQLLRDELAIMKRKYEDIIYNLDDENFSSRFVKEKNNMRTSIEQTEEAITLQAERIDENEEAYASLKVTADGISSEVKKVQDDVKQYSTVAQTVEGLTVTVGEVKTNLTANYYTKTDTDSQISVSAGEITSAVSATYETRTDAGEKYGNLQSQIEQTQSSILLTVDGKIEDSELGIKEYYTGIGISENGIKMSHDSVYSIYNSNGLRFYDSTDQAEGWAIEPNKSFGGILSYYINNSKTCVFGLGQSGEKYNTSDITLKAENTNCSRFIVDLSNSGYREVKFVGLNYPTGLKENSPCIYANEKLLATQEWVLENAGGGTATAVFA